MSERKWQDHYLCDVIEAQLVLFFHLSEALDLTGVLPRRLSAEALRRTAEDNELRPGVRSCVRAVAELLERASAQQAGPAWQPRVVPGGANGGGNGAGNGGGNGAGNGAGNGQAANGSLPADWRPRLVGDDDPDCA
jgi:hypothetical protein